MALMQTQLVNPMFYSQTYITRGFYFGGSMTPRASVKARDVGR